MPFSRADTLAAAQLSLQRAAARDRTGWLDLFTADARIEDPVGSRAHRGRDQIDAFYRTFIGPRQITAHPGRDLVTEASVVRDVTLEVVMSPSVTMLIPAYLRYELHPEDLRITRLQAFWELPAMIGQFLRAGAGAAPVGVRLAGALLRHQGLRGTAGFLGGLRGVGRPGRRDFAAFLADAGAGDEVAVGCRLPPHAQLRDGAGAPMTPADLLDRLAGNTVARGRHRPPRRWPRGAHRRTRRRAESRGQGVALLRRGRFAARLTAAGRGWTERVSSPEDDDGVTGAEARSQQGSD